MLRGLLPIASSRLCTSPAVAPGRMGDARNDAAMKELKKILLRIEAGIRSKRGGTRRLAGERNIGLVYGGGTVGLMGVIAKTVFNGLGHSGVIGVIPEALAPRELSGEMIGELQTVPDMHTRKALMAKQSDGFIAMPGGFGTLEELMEVVTWQQLGFHAKPIGLLNVAGFYDPLVSFFQHCVTEGFVKPEYCTVVVSADPVELLQKMRDFRAPLSVIETYLKQQGPDGIDVSTSAPS